jgi:hypothetical protein
MVLYCEGDKMKRSQKEYRCDVCNEVVSTNMLIGVGYTCSICDTSFQKDESGIFITKEPSQEWRRRNAIAWESWQSKKGLVYPYPKYVEVFE